jgi:hypothetical protein
LGTHQFDEILGWHDPAQSTPMRRETLRFSQIANKKTFDEVFVQFGRSLKPDLIVAQWNHLGDFNQINPLSARHIDSFAEGNDSELLPSRAYHAHLTGTDFAINSNEGVGRSLTRGKRATQDALSG